MHERYVGISWVFIWSIYLTQRVPIFHQLWILLLYAVISSSYLSYAFLLVDCLLRYSSSILITLGFTGNLYSIGLCLLPIRARVDIACPISVSYLFVGVLLAWLSGLVNFFLVHNCLLNALTLINADN